MVVQLNDHIVFDLNRIFQKDNVVNVIKFGPINGSMIVDSIIYCAPNHECRIQNHLGK